MVLALSGTGVIPGTAAWASTQTTQKSVLQLPAETPYLKEETAAAPDEKCAELLIVGVRGSGESAGMGEKVQAAVTEVENHIGAKRSIRNVALDYPALSTDYIKTDVADALQMKSNWVYLSSVGRGTLALGEVLGDSMLKCPTERWILVGYSQGSLVINNAVEHYSDPSSMPASSKLQIQHESTVRWYRTRAARNRAKGSLNTLASPGMTPRLASGL